MSGTQNRVLRVVRWALFFPIAIVVYTVVRIGMVLLFGPPDFQVEYATPTFVVISEMLSAIAFVVVAVWIAPTANKARLALFVVIIAGVLQVWRIYGAVDDGDFDKLLLESRAVFGVFVGLFLGYAVFTTRAREIWSRVTGR